MPSDRIEVVLGDITREVTDAIVNAANPALRGGGGVDGAIHRAGGPQIMAECRRFHGGCPVGEAVITTAGNLRARHVIHAVGPRYRGRPEDAALLASAYRNSLLRAFEAGDRTVSFPSISTGAYGYPVGEAAEIAVRTVSAFLDDHPEMRVRFVCFDERTLGAFEAALASLREEG